MRPEQAAVGEQATQVEVGIVSGDIVQNSLDIVERLVQEFLGHLLRDGPDGVGHRLWEYEPEKGGQVLPFVIVGGGSRALVRQEQSTVLLGQLIQWHRVPSMMLSIGLEPLQGGAQGVLVLVAVSGGNGDAVQGCFKGAGLLKTMGVPSTIKRLLEAVEELQGLAGLVRTASSVGFVWALYGRTVRIAKALAVELERDEDAVTGIDQFEVRVGGHSGTVCGTVLLLMLCFSRGCWSPVGKAPALGAGDRRFESCYPDTKDLLREVFLFLTCLTKW